MDQMTKHCNHSIPETKKGLGPCDIRWEVKKRSGKPNWWCHTHGLTAAAPDGAALPECSGAWFDPTPSDMRYEIDVEEGELAIWGALAPAIAIGTVPKEPGKVHVHQRPTAGASKDTDESYDMVTIHAGAASVVIEAMAATAYSISILNGVDVVPLECPHCGEVHIDELMFATHPHIKHLCNACGRNFRDKHPSVSNPLGGLQNRLGLPPLAEPRRVNRPLNIASSDYSGVELWPSNQAIISTMSRPEDEGIHVHAFSPVNTRVIDDTYSPVTLDGEEIDERALRLLVVQRELVRRESKRPPIVSLECTNCGASIMSPTSGWVEPSTHHSCQKCSTDNRTRRKSFVNPYSNLGQGHS